MKDNGSFEKKIADEILVDYFNYRRKSLNSRKLQRQIANRAMRKIPVLVHYTRDLETMNDQLRKKLKGK